MNKNLYRVVFNRALNLLQVVSELARRNISGAGTCVATGRKCVATIRPLRFAFALITGQAVIMPLANAGILADPAAPGNQRPTVLEAANGVPLVNIQTPGAAGVSRNTYQQFDVDQQGAILNNSRSNTQTDLGGWVQGNPWLARGSARIILNEVNSANPARLQGYVEVAGERAQLVIASPAGISCDGCGFINASRATITTGKPVISRGVLEGYRVEGGTIQVHGKGMDSKNADYTDLIARSAEVNAGIWAQQLQVTTGSTEVSADHTRLQKKAVTGNAPAFALDVAALGGMYSQKIVLTGTEHGVGVRNAGSIGAQAGGLIVTADGRLENTGAMQAKNDTRIDVSGGVANTGTISAGSELIINSVRDINNRRGTLNARRIEISARSLSNPGGSIGQTGMQNLTVQAAGVSNRDGGSIGITAAGTGEPPGRSGTLPARTATEITATDGAANNGNSQPEPGMLSLADGSLNISATLDNDGGSIVAGGDIDLIINAGLNNDGGRLGVRQLDIRGDRVSNRKGEIKVAADMRTDTLKLNNDSGLIQLAGSVVLNSDDFFNRGGIFRHSGNSDTHLKIKGEFDNSAGELLSNAQQLTLDAGQLINTRGQISHSGAGELVVNTGRFSGAGGKTVSAGSIRLRTSDGDHRHATLSAKQLYLDTGNLDNRGGRIIATGSNASDINVAGILNNSDGGMLASNADLRVRASILSNENAYILHRADGQLNISVSTLNGENGTITSNGRLKLKGETVNLTGAGTQAMSVSADSNTMITAKGKLVASGSEALELRIYGAMDNSGGVIASNGSLDLRAKSLGNHGGMIAATGTDASHIMVTDGVDNSSGTLITLGDTVLKSAFLNNVKGSLQHTGRGTLTITAADLNGAGGTMLSNGRFVLNSGKTDFSGATTQADGVSIIADSLTMAEGSLISSGSESVELNIAGAMDNSRGTIAANAAIHFTGKSLNNQGGRISAATSAVSRFQITDQLDNTGGTIVSAGDTILKAAALSNQRGSVIATGQAALTVTIAGSLDNSDKGSLAAGGEMIISAHRLNNQQGSIQHTGDSLLTLRVNTMQSTGGSIATHGALGLSGDSTDLSNATLIARRININTGSLTTSGGRLTATGSELLTIHVRNRADNTGGTITGNGGLDLQAQSLDNQHGTISAAGSTPGRIAIAGDFNNTGGSLVTAGNMLVSASELHNQRGVVATANQSGLDITVKHLLDNSGGGTLATAGDLAVRAGGLDNRDGSVRHAGEGTAKITTDSLHGARGNIVSNGFLVLSSDSTDTSDGIIQGKKLRIDSGTLTNVAGMIIATGDELLQLHARQSVDNSGGTIAGNGVLDLQAQSLSSQSGNIRMTGSGDSRIVVSGLFDNQRGNVMTAGNSTIKADHMHNQHGMVHTAGQSALTLRINGTLDNSSKGSLSAPGDMFMSASVLDNRDGIIRHAGTGNAMISVTDLSGTGGSIASNGRLEISGDTTDLSAGSTFAGHIHINTSRLLNAGGKLIAAGGGMLLRVREALDNSRGSIASNTGLDLSAGSLNNRAGSLQAAGDAASRIEVTHTFDNTRGSLGTAGAMTLIAGELANQGGKVQTSADAMTLSVTGRLDNQNRGVIAGTGNASVSAADLDNRGGTLNAAGKLITAIAQLLDNRAGKLISGADLSLRAEMLDNSNTGMVVSTGGGLEVNTAGHTENAGGILQGKGDVSLSSSGLSNAAGAVLGASVTVNSRRMLLDNTGGTIASTRSALSVDSGMLNNTGGLLQSAGAMRLDTHSGSLINTDAGSTGGILSAGTLSLNSGSLNNRAGVLHSQNDLVIVSGLMDNSGAKTASNASVRISAASLNNGSGRIQAGSNLTVSLSDVADNNAGLLVAGNDLMVSATRILNRNTQSSDSSNPLGLQGRNVTLAGNHTDNSMGIIAADSQISIRGPASLSTLDNTSGSLSSAGGISILLSRVLNQAGTLLASRSLDVTADSLEGNGRLLSGGNLTLSLQQDFSNISEITANGRALISTTGLLTNNRVIQAGDLEVRGGRINNSITGSMSAGRTAVIVRDSLINSGLIDGTYTRIGTGTLDNTSTGRIYGDHLAIKAGTINNLEENGRAAVIAARQRLDIGAGFINNHQQALIFSAGSGSEAMKIGGTLDSHYHASGQAEQIFNNSATIESLGGMSIASRRLVNRNLDFATELLQLGEPEEVVYIQPKGSPDKHLISEYQHENFSKAGRYRHKITRAQVRNWTQYEVIRTRYQTTVSKSAPAMIRAAGNITLQGNELSNDKSQIIAGGTLRGDLHNLKNVMVFGEHVIHEQGTSQYTYSEWRGGTRRIHERHWNSKILYTPADTVTTIDLPVSAVIQNAAGGSSGFTVDGRTSGHMNTTVAKSANLTGSTDYRQITEVRASVNSVHAPAIAAVHSTATDDSAAETLSPLIRLNGRDSHPQPVVINSVAEETAGMAEETASITGPDKVNPSPLSWRNEGSQTGTADKFSAAAPLLIRTVQADTSIPASSLFRMTPGASDYLIETDPGFTNYRNWLSSGYMLSRLSYDPARIHKRLGDGFYEQKLIRDQITLLTGRRFLDGYTSDEAQYRALLDAGITYAKQWNLRPGIALSAEQMAQLTSDIVWLVERDITLADGSTTRALVPQLYVRVKPGDLDGSGALIAADSIDINLKGDLVNSGTIAGRTAVKLSSENLRNLSGRISGDVVSLSAGVDVDNTGGTFTASRALLVQAGRDLRLTSTTRTDAKQAGLSDFSRTNMDRVAGLYVTSPGGILLASAGRDVSLLAAKVTNSGRQGETAITAGRDLTLGSVSIAEQENNILNASNYLTQGYERDMGTTMDIAGNLRLQADRDLNAIAASITSEHGNLLAVAQGEVNLLAGKAENNWSEGRQHTSRSLFGSSRNTTRDSLQQNTLLSAIFSGNTVAVQGKNVTITGSHIVSDAGTAIAAGQDLTIRSASGTTRESHFREISKTGFLYNGGTAFTIGKQMQSADRRDVNTHAVASAVGSVAGDIVLSAGNHYRQTGSHVAAATGDIDIHARKVAIAEARETGTGIEESKFRQSGLTVALSAPVISAIQTAGQMKRAASNTTDRRMKLLAPVTSGLAAYDAYNAVKASPQSGGGVSISVTVGASSSDSKTTTRYDSASGAGITAGGDVRISATGAGHSSDLTVQGSNISAGGNAQLKADGDINLLAASNTMETKRVSSSASGGVGVAISAGQGGFSMGITASASYGRGKGEGRDISWTNAHISAGRQLELESGGDTKVRGAVARGAQVIANVGGDLNIASLQDTSVFRSKDMHISGSVTAGMGFSGSASMSLQKLNSNYAGVSEQSGITAGDGGFRINVRGNTDLKGGLIASSQNATDNNRNQLTTASLTTSDLSNHASVSASSIGAGLSSAMFSQGKYGMAKGAIGNALSNGRATDSSAGHTRSAISGGVVQITDAAKQRQLSGAETDEVIAALNRDTERSHQAANRTEAGKLEHQAQAGHIIKQAAAQELFKFTDDAYKTMFTDSHDLFVAKVVKDDSKTEGIKTNSLKTKTRNVKAGEIINKKFQIIRYHQLSEQEKQHLKPDSDGLVHISFNGIFNDLPDAVGYAVQHRANDQEPVYLQQFPRATNALSELMIAGYQNLLENDFFGLSNSTQQAKTLQQTYGATGLVLHAHSRGSMTTGNAMESLQRDGATGSLSATRINFYGPAYNAQKAADLLYSLSNGSQDAVYLQNHRDDFVGSLIGMNPYTHEKRPAESYKVKEWINMFTSDETVHNCYGKSDDRCQNNYGFPNTLPVKAKVNQ